MVFIRLLLSNSRLWNGSSGLPVSCNSTGIVCDWFWCLFLEQSNTMLFSNNCSSYFYREYYYYSNYTSDPYGLSNTNTLYNLRVPLIRGQLAAGALMFASCVIYIVIFAITNHRVSKDAQFPEVKSTPGPVMPAQPAYVAPVPQSFLPPPLVIPNFPSTEVSTIISPPKNEIICPTCRSSFQVARQQN